MTWKGVRIIVWFCIFILLNNWSGLHRLSIGLRYRLWEGKLLLSKYIFYNNYKTPLVDL
jgi:hypothetical protein